MCYWHQGGGGQACLKHLPLHRTAPLSLFLCELPLLQHSASQIPGTSGSSLCLASEETAVLCSASSSVHCGPESTPRQKVGAIRHLTVPLLSGSKVLYYLCLVPENSRSIHFVWFSYSSQQEGKLGTSYFVIAGGYLLRFFFSLGIFLQ